MFTCVWDVLHIGDSLYEVFIALYFIYKVKNISLGLRESILQRTIYSLLIVHKLLHLGNSQQAIRHLSDERVTPYQLPKQGL